MKVTKEKSAANRAALVAAAATLFRARGFSNVSVVEIATAAGLTPGAFYSHFKSKGDVEAEACETLVSNAARFWQELISVYTERPLAAIVDEYLTHDHAGDPLVGCAFAALGPELARSTGKARRAVTAALPQQLDTLAGLLPGDREETRRQALGVYITLVGAAVVARGIENRAMAEEIRAYAAAAILGERNTTRQTSKGGRPR